MMMGALGGVCVCVCGEGLQAFSFRESLPPPPTGVSWFAKKMLYGILLW